MLHRWDAKVQGNANCLCVCRGMPVKQPQGKLPSVLQKHFSNTVGVSLQRVTFGSSGHVGRPRDGGPLVHYTKCSGQLSHRTKCMARTNEAAPRLFGGGKQQGCSYRCALDP